MRRLTIILLLTATIIGGLFCAQAQATAKGLDTSQRPTAAGYRQIAAQGYEFVGRYLAIPGGGKVYPVTRAELANAKAVGVDVFLIFEWCSGKASLLPDDRARGFQDGKLAQRALKSLGLPADTVVYFSLDRGNETVAEALAYFRGIRTSGWRASAVGCYGSKAQLTALQKAGLISHLFYATWMDGNNIAPGWGETLYQRTWIVTRGGVKCDQCWAFADVGGVR